jgi:hypothetical protein
VLQLISVLGALAILGAYAASQFGLADTSKPSYQVANFLGSAVLTVVAVIDRQLGFILLEGAWALVEVLSAEVRCSAQPDPGVPCMPLT